MTEAEWMDELKTAFERNGIGGLLTPESAGKLYLLANRLTEANNRFNLTAIKEPKKIILLHFADSLFRADLFPAGADVIDVGCGAGFPSLPLAVCRPDLNVSALDSTAKKIGFVEETAAFLGLSNVKTLVGRAEDLANDPRYRETFDVSTARAVAALPVLAELCLPLVKNNGLFIALKGKNAEAEIRDAYHGIEMLGGELLSAESNPLRDENGETYARASVVIRKKRNTPRLYPRPYAKIIKSPLK